MFPLFILSEIYVCDHDFIAAEQLRSEEPQSFAHRFDADDGTNWTTANRVPIKIYFDFGGLHVGQCNIDSKPENCTNYPTLTQSNIDVINETFTNIKAKFESYLKVTPYYSKTGQRKINLKELSQTLYSGSPDETPEEADIYILVREMGFSSTSNVLAQASAFAYVTNKSDLNRPIAGYINLNLRKLPATPQSFTSGNRQFFMTCLHEMTHVLGFSSSRIGSWIDRETGSPYAKNPVVEVQTATGPKFSYIQTPYLKKWVNEIFQLSSVDVKDIGLQLEDYGGSGTAGSHPNEHLFFTDYMQGVTFGPGYLTQLALNALMDCGWYDIDFGVAQPLSYLNSTLFRFAPNETIVTGPPQYTFPEEILCKEGEHKCFYDYAFKGTCATQSAAKARASATLTWYPSYYNPTNAATLGFYEVLDFANVLVPTSTNCRDPSTASDDSSTYLEEFTENSSCMMSTLVYNKLGSLILEPTPTCHRVICGTDGRLRVGVTVDGVTKYTLCKEEGQPIRVSGATGRIICPDPAKACASIPKELMINIQSALPDRGPKDGGNLILFSGYDFDKYENLTVSVANIPCIIKGQTDTEILCMLDNPEKYLGSQLKKMLLTPLNVNAVGIQKSNKQILNSTLEQMYTIMNRNYNAGEHRFSPAAVLLCFSAAIALIATFF